MKKNLFSLGLLALLAACGSTPSKDQPVASVPAATSAAAATPAAPLGAPAAQPAADAVRSAAQAAAAPAARTQADANASAAAKAQAAAEADAAARAAAAARAQAEAAAAAAEDQLMSRRSVFFPFDVDAVQPSDLETIQSHAAYLADHPELAVRVEGHADERGSSEYNLALGQRRANNAKKALVLGGARASQIETISYGEEKPKALGHDEAAWAQNRRADIVYGR